MRRQKQKFEIQKRQGMFWLSERLLTSQGFCSMRLLSTYIIDSEPAMNIPVVKSERLTASSLHKFSVRLLMQTPELSGAIILTIYNGGKRVVSNGD
jgi:hypothetical protein